eukprot:UN13697
MSLTNSFWSTEFTIQSNAYFAHHGIGLVKLVYRAHEADKT